MSSRFNTIYLGGRVEQLKGAIVSLRDVVFHDGKIDAALLEEVVKLLKFLINRGVIPVLVSNTGWVLEPEKRPFQDYLSDKVGIKLNYFQRGVDGMSAKQSAAGMSHVLGHFGWAAQNAVYIGSTDEDMQAARNGKLLFLNAQWHAKQSPYGFEFESPLDVARFIDCCCLSTGDWFWSLEKEGLRVYCIAPLAEYSKRYPQAAGYSTDAKQAVKFDYGNLPYWGRLMAAKIHLSGLGREANYVAPYPGHKPESKRMLLANSLKIVAGSLSGQYLDDLIVRHVEAKKSQTLRLSGVSPTHENQLSSIRLRRDPIRTGATGIRYVNPPLKKGRKVLVVDDICTEGFSLEAARAFVEATGAEAILVTWLKTPANSYQALRELSPEIKDPYAPYTLTSSKADAYSFDSGIRNADAPTEIAKAFERYASWAWPS